MSSIVELHNQAMNLAEAAELARLRGDQAGAHELSKAAMESESEAALVAVKEDAPEPTRSVLLRSAASLALDCEEFRRAEKLIAVALAGEPPPDIADELRDLLEDAHFERHLQLRGVSLLPNEIQLSVTGKAVGFGVMRIDEYLSRVRSIETLIYRTSERRQGRPYRVAGDASAEIKRMVSPFISAPRPGSIAATIRLGSALQKELFHRSLAEEVLEDVLECVNLYEHCQENEMRDRIKDSDYFQNFVALVKRLGPDGEEIETVGLTALTSGKVRRVKLTRTRQSVALESANVKGAAVEPGPSKKQLRLKGKLELADNRKSTRSTKIIIEEENGTQHPVLVPRALMADIVKPLFDELVEVIASRKGRSVVLEDILPIKE